MLPENIKPVGKFIVMKMLKLKNKVTEGGIIIPDAYDVPKQSEAEILAIGKDVKEDIRVGGKILVNAFVGRNFYEKGQDDSIRVITADNIWLVIE